MPEYKTPGVYVEEISTLPPSVAQVETAIPAFIGYTQIADEKTTDDLLNVPKRITSMVEYRQFFGGPMVETFTVDIVEDDSTAISTFTVNPTSAPSLTYRMYYAMQMYFTNGGGPCWVVSAGTGYSGPIANTDMNSTGALAEIAKEDEPTILVFPDIANITDTGQYYGIYNDALTQASNLGDRVVLIDAMPDEDIQVLRDNIASDLDLVKYGAVYHPYLRTTLSFHFDDDSVTIGNHTTTSGGAPATDLSTTAISDSSIKEDQNDLYNKIRQAVGRPKVTLAPSAAMAGIYARVDADRGVWKAPANVSVLGVTAPTIKITEESQRNLNVDTAGGKSVNAIRAFTGKGILVWGARTLAGNDNEWRYVPVRRLYNMAEESLKKATNWVVFEPNDANTWIRVRAQAENFLTRLWRDGALAGATPEDAFFVRVGLGVTMTAVDILEGRLIVEIGMAAVRPAEFIILRFSHKLQES